MSKETLKRLGVLMDKMRRFFNVFRREEVSQEQIDDFSEGDRHA